MSKKTSQALSVPKSGRSEQKHDVFQAIADPTRREILKLLADAELPIASISEHFPISRTAINKHLHVLSDAKLVKSRRKGREVRYQANPAPLIEVKAWMSFFDSYWDEKLHFFIQYVESGDE